MAHRGPAQSARKLGRTPNADWTEVANLDYDGPSPDLPKLPRRKKWHEMVVQWWEITRHMPHCVRWSPADWQYALETAFMKQRYWERYDDGEENITAGVDLRRREDNMGTTEEARRKLRIRYVDVEPDDVADELGGDAEQPVVVHQERAGGARPVTSLASRRARAVAEQQRSADTA